MADMFTVASKEFSDIVRSKRLIILITIFTLVMIGAMASLVPMGGPMPRKFLMTMASSLADTLPWFGPVIGLALGCDTISGEREKGTLKMILAQPVYRDTLINGKFLAATSSLSLAILITSLLNMGVSIIVIGVTPTGGEALRVALFLPFSILFTMTYYGIAAFLSTILKKTSQSVIVSVTVWAVFTFVVPILASLIAFTIAPPYAEPPTEPPLERPPDQTSPQIDISTGSWRRFNAVVEAISSISPNYHFNKIGQYLLYPTATYTMTPQGEFIRGEEPSVVSSLIYAGPNILVLVIVTVLVFIFSYIAFTRQEVR